MDFDKAVAFFKVSTHSRAEAAAAINAQPTRGRDVSTHSRAEAAAGLSEGLDPISYMFQHTAARRRLPMP